MRIVTVTAPGGPENLTISEAPDPVADAGEVVISVRAAGVNRADLLQRQGHYPPPSGVSDVIGLEVSGTIASIGEGVGQRKRNGSSGGVGHPINVDDNFIHR